MTVFEEVARLRKTKFGELLQHGHAAGWIVRTYHGTPNFKEFRLPDIDFGVEELFDVELQHPVADVAFLVRFRAEKVGDVFGVYKFHAVRCTASGVFKKSGGSPAQVLHYMGANSMGCPR